MAAGFLGSIFFAAAPSSNPLFVVASLLLAVVGFILIADEPIAPDDDLEVGESTAARRRRWR